MDTWTVNIVLVRHGFSIVNALSHIGDLPFPESKLEHIVDPHLTSFGVEASKANGREFFEKLGRIKMFKDGLNLVLSSNLTRAIETAFFMQNRRKEPLPIFVMPFLKETGVRQKRKGPDQACTTVSHPWNRPATLKEQKRYLKKLGANVDYGFIDEDREWDTDSGILKFLKWFGKGGRFLLILKAGRDLTPKQAKSKSFNVMIVCHGGIMAKFLEEHQADYRHPPDNNEAFYGSVMFSNNGTIQGISNFKNVNYANMVQYRDYPTEYAKYCNDPRSSPICP